MTTPDPASAAAASAVRATLSVQSASIAGILARLRAAQTRLTPPPGDGWRGVAEQAQSVLVAAIDGTAERACVELERARQLTDAAVWTMPDGR